MDQLTLNIELSRLAPSQFQNFAFTELVEWNGKYFAAAADGIYEIETGDSDDGSPIPTRWDLPNTDFGSENQKRLRRIYASGEFKAVTIDETEYSAITVTVIDDEGSERTFSLVPESTDGKQVGARANIDRDGKGRHWQVKIESTGADYSIDRMSAVIINLFRKPAGI